MQTLEPRGVEPEDTRTILRRLDAGGEVVETQTQLSDLFRDLVRGDDRGAQPPREPEERAFLQEPGSSF